MDNEISRRNLLKLTAGAATALAGSNWVFRATGDGRIVKAQATDGVVFKPVYLTEAEVQQLATVCETIIPKTDTPGARDARVHEYIDVALSVETDPVRKRFRDGLAWLEAQCRDENGKGLAEAGTDELVKLLTSISDYNANVAEDLKPGASFFTDVKARTIFGFYTSREGWVEDLGRPEHVGMEKFTGCAHPDHAH